MTHEHDKGENHAATHSRGEVNRPDEVKTDAEATPTHRENEGSPGNDVPAGDRTTADSTEAIANPTEVTDAATGRGADAATGSLLPTSEESDIMRRWETIQAAFVDEPRKAVEEADQLVAGLMRLLAKSFAETRAELERQWDRGDRISTEDLRLTLQRYRSFFERLLKA